MNLFTKSCKCGGMIFGLRVGGKARGQWLGYDECTDCRENQSTKGDRAAQQAPGAIK